jgi:hypothetical protein
MHGITRSALVVAVVAAGTGGNALAAEAVTAVYAFRWAGLDVGRFEVQLEAVGSGYRALWEGGTEGVVGALFPFVSEGMAEGRRDGDRFLPTTYGGRSEWRDGDSQWQVAFAPDGRATRVEVPAEDLAERDPVPDELRVAPDPASLALAAIERAGPGLRMDGQSFDGRRSVRLELACGEPDADAELACTISGHLVAGGSREWREGARTEPPREPVRIWLREGVHGDGFWPVRVEAPSRFGTVEVRLVSIDRTPSAG